MLFLPNVFPHSFKGPGVLVCSIDNMPTQLPRESTDFFGDLLMPYMEDIIMSDAYKPFMEQHFSPEVEEVGRILLSNTCVPRVSSYLDRFSRIKNPQTSEN